jgi:hypothetical protein
VSFVEESATPAVRSVGLSHLSLELGHLYMDDFEAGPERLRDHFARVAPWAAVASEAAAAQLPDRARPRISTCFLIDDYFTRFSTPKAVIRTLLSTAAEAGLTIDYVARESGCATADDVDVAAVVEGHLVSEPPEGTTGSRPPVTESGWLTNGERSPTTAGAMAAPRAWQPPRQSAARNHSIFLDVELWNETDGRRLWSCPFLAAVWQLQRLGQLRHLGAPIADPVPATAPGDLPDDWDALPPVLQLAPRAAPFRAYRTFSVLDARFLAVEVAVRTILSQVTVAPGVAAQTLDRAAAEKLTLPADITGRIRYAFL